MNRKLLTISAGFVLLLALSLTAGWFYAQSLPKTYSASAMVKVDKKALLYGLIMCIVDKDFLQAECGIIQSQTILLPVMRKLELDEKIKQRAKTPLSDEKICKIFLRKYLQVRQAREPMTIEITALAPSPGEAADIANAVASQYWLYYWEKGRSAFDEAVTPFKEAVAAQEKIVNQLNNKVDELREERIRNLGRFDRLLNR